MPIFITIDILYSGKKCGDEFHFIMLLRTAINAEKITFYFAERDADCSITGEDAAAAWWQYH